MFPSFFSYLKEGRMAGKVRFYRGAKGTSLPATHQNGAIFIIERDDTANLGDMYVDMDDGKRLHIIPDQPFQVYTSSQSGNISTKGSLYVEYEKDENNQNQITNAYVRVGDGDAYIGDLPVYSAKLYDAIKNKVNAYLGTEYLTLLNSDQLNADNLNVSQATAAETLVLSHEL